MRRCIFIHWALGNNPVIRFATYGLQLQLLKLHKNLVNKKYSTLFSRKSKCKPGPKGASQDIINAVIAMKQRNPRFGCRRIAMQMNNMFGLNIDKDIVRHILAKYYRPTSADKEPSWLTFIGHMKDSL